MQHRAVLSKCPLFGLATVFLDPRGVFQWYLQEKGVSAKLEITLCSISWTLFYCVYFLSKLPIPADTSLLHEHRNIVLLPVEYQRYCFSPECKDVLNVGTPQISIGRAPLQCPEIEPTDGLPADRFMGSIFSRRGFSASSGNQVDTLPPETLALPAPAPLALPLGILLLPLIQGEPLWPPPLTSGHPPKSGKIPPCQIIPPKATPPPPTATPCLAFAERDDPLLPRTALQSPDSPASPPSDLGRPPPLPKTYHTLPLASLSASGSPHEGQSAPVPPTPSPVPPASSRYSSPSGQGCNQHMLVIQHVLQFSQFPTFLPQLNIKQKILISPQALLPSHKCSHLHEVLNMQLYSLYYSVLTSWESSISSTNGNIKESWDKSLPHVHGTKPLRFTIWPLDPQPDLLRLWPWAGRGKEASGTALPTLSHYTGTLRSCL